MDGVPAGKHYVTIQLYRPYSPSVDSCKLESHCELLVVSCMPWPGTDVLASCVCIYVLAGLAGWSDGSVENSIMVSVCCATWHQNVVVTSVTCPCDLSL
jgi:hypothetical protein